MLPDLAVSALTQDNQKLANMTLAATTWLEADDALKRAERTAAPDSTRVLTLRGAVENAKERFRGYVTRGGADAPPAAAKNPEPGEVGSNA